MRQPDLPCGVTVVTVKNGMHDLLKVHAFWRQMRFQQATPLNRGVQNPISYMRILSWSLSIRTDSADLDLRGSSRGRTVSGEAIG